MDRKDVISKIRQEIAEDNFEAAFLLLKGIIPSDSENYERLFEYRGKFKHIETEKNRGTIDYAHYSIEMNNIHLGLIELVKLEFPNDYEDDEEKLGIFDYWDRFQINSVKMREFVLLMQEGIKKYLENSNNTTAKLNKLKDQSLKKPDPSINQKVKGIMLEMASSVNTYRESMEKDIGAFAEISKTLISDLFNYMTFLSDYAPQGKLSLLISLEKNIAELLKLYEEFEKIARSSANLHSSKTAELSQQIKVAYKKMLVLDHQMLSASQQGIKMAKDYQNQVNALMFREKLSLTSFRGLFKYLFRILFKRKMKH